MDINCNIENKDDIVVFTIQQEKINQHHVAALKEKLFLEIADGNVNIILNLVNVDSIDSSGLGAILFGTRQARNAGGNLVLLNVNDQIQTIIRIAQLGKNYDIFTSLEDATAFFNK